MYDRRVAALLGEDDLIGAKNRLRGAEQRTYPSLLFIITGNAYLIFLSQSIKSVTFLTLCILRPMKKLKVKDLKRKSTSKR